MIVKTNDFGQYGVLKTKFYPYNPLNGEITITSKIIRLKKTIGEYATQFGIICRKDFTIFPCKCIVVKARKTIDTRVNLNAFLYLSLSSDRWQYRNDISKEWKYYAYYGGGEDSLTGIEIQLYKSDVGSEVEISEIYALPYIPESFENIDKSYLTADSNKLMEEMN